MKLHLGCGGQILKGYVNIDKYIIRPDVVNMDIKHLEYADNSAEEIMALQCLEHLTFQDSYQCLKECYRVLKLNGKIVLEVPNIEFVIKNFYSKETTNKDRWGENVEQCLNGRITCVFGHNLPPSGGQQHFQAFDEFRLKRDLEYVGFKEVIREYTNILSPRTSDEDVLRMIGVK